MTLRLIASLALAAALAANAEDKKPTQVLSSAQIQQHLAKFAPVELSTDLSKLSDTDKKVLGHLVLASRMMNPLFLRQSWTGNDELLMRLAGDTSAAGRLQLAAFLLNQGPWSRLELQDVFVAGVGPKPEPGNFYPAGATKADVEAWMKALPPAEKTRAESYFTTIRKGPDGKFVLVPYSVEYQAELGIAAQHLRDAAALTTNATLKAFLEKRAAAFLSNDYYASDVAWMELDSSVEPTIGPYEVYEDGWFNYKASFEAFITVRDDAESQKLARFSGQLQDVENHLPIDPKLRNPKLGALAPIRVVNSIFCSGDGNHGVQTAAYNLPNDEHVTAEKGTKRVMLRNVQEAKFQKVLLPISKIALAPADQKNVAFDAFFTHILMHELMHGLGPHVITVNGKQTTVRNELQEQGGAIEEAKADISGLFAMQYLVDQGAIDKSMERTMYTTFLASAFRSIRFGLDEAHGRGQAMQVNYLLDKGAFVVNKDGTFSVNAAKVKDGVKDLTHDLLMLEANGDKAGAKAMLEKLAVVRPEVKRVLDRLTRIPVDIAPRFTQADKLAAEAQ